MSINDLSTEKVAETKEFLASIGRDELADRFDAELSEREDAARTLVEIKTTLEKADDAGLDDDPAVEALRERAAALEADLELTDPHAPEKLAEDHGVREDVAAELSEDTRQDLKADLVAVEELETSRSRLAEHELRERRESLNATLASADVEAAELVAEDAPTPQAELSAALAATDGEDVDDSGTDRIHAARLRDRKADLKEEIDGAESALLELTLRDRLDDVEATLSDLEGA
jgi:hypothetical protein